MEQRAEAMILKLFPTDTTIRGIQRMDAGLFKNVERIRIRATAPGLGGWIDISDASSAENVLSIEGSPTIKAADEAAEDYIPCPHDLASRIAGQAIKEII